MNTTIPTDTYPAERNEFLTNVLSCAIDHRGYGWFHIDEYELPENDGTAYALVTEDEDKTQYRLDIDTVAKGIAVIKAAGAGEFPAGVGQDVERDLANAETGERLFLSGSDREAILEADRENDATDIDVVLALAIVECGLFGQVRYA